MKKLLFIFAFSSFLTFGVPGALADSFDFKDTLSDFQEDVSEQSGEMQEDALGEDYNADEGTGIELTTFNEEGDEGADIIVSAIRRFLDFFKLLVTPIAILVIVIMGARMVAAGQADLDSPNADYAIVFVRVGMRLAWPELAEVYAVGVWRDQTGPCAETLNPAQVDEAIKVHNLRPRPA